MGFTASPPANTPFLGAGSGVSLPWLAWLGSLSKPTWSSWVPTMSAGGSMTVSSVSVLLATYVQNGPAVTFSLSLSFTLGGSASADVYISLPIAPAGFVDYIFLAASGTPAGGPEGVLQAWATTLVPGGLLLHTNPSASWPLGAQVGIRVSGTYQVG